MNLNSYKIPGTTYNVSNMSLLGTPNITLIPILTCDPSAEPGGASVHQPELLHLPDPDRRRMARPCCPAIYGPAFFNADLGLFKNFQIKEKKKLQFRFERLQLPESPAVVVQRHNLTLGFNGATGVINTPLSVRDHQAGPPHRAAGREFYF